MSDDTGHSVQFDPSVGIEDGERRERYLTAKYGAHQMQLIRKRIATEQWLIDELQKITESSNIEIDLDELLDINGDSDRHTFLHKKLQHLNLNTDISNKFVLELLERAKKL